MRGLRRVVLAGGLALGLAAAACGGTEKTTSGPTGGNSSGGSSNKVDASLSDFSIGLGSDSATAGSVTFAITNKGPSEHEFVVLRTDLPADQIPTKTESGALVAAEDASNVENVGEAEDIAADSSTTLTLDLTAGNYVLICNLPGHYIAGMRVPFTVGT